MEPFVFVLWAAAAVLCAALAHWMKTPPLYAFAGVILILLGLSIGHTGIASESWINQTIEARTYQQYWGYAITYDCSQAYNTTWNGTSCVFADGTPSNLAWTSKNESSLLPLEINRTITNTRRMAYEQSTWSGTLEAILILLGLIFLFGGAFETHRKGVTHA